MPVRPIDAASLVPVRSRGAHAEVLMGRRARRHRFLPDVYVFPGGRVDRGDHRVAPLTPLRPEVAQLLAQSASQARARALAVAAVRETWEETGLALGELRDGILRPDLHALDHIVRAITPTASPIRFHARFFVADAARLQGALRGNGELLDLDWRPIERCLALPLADITEFVLGELRHWLRTRHAPARAPLFTYRHGRASVQR
ncbi:MAG: NUDIX hydrolase [Burkholderiales bacterium]|nr:NUDIX hydrolase [Burkholderiales bacterium]